MNVTPIPQSGKSTVITQSINLAHGNLIVCISHVSVVIGGKCIH